MTEWTPSREELFEMVWSAPATKVASQLGISDVALGKLCSKLQVPKPPRGYWARVEAGQRLRKPALPAFREENEQKASSKKLPGARLSQRKKELFLSAAQEASVSVQGADSEIRGERIVSIDPRLAAAVIVVVGNRFRDILAPAANHQGERAAHEVSRGLVQLLLPLAAPRVLVFKRPPRSKWDTDEPKTVLVRVTDQLLQDVTTLRNLVVEYDLSFTARALSGSEYTQQVRYAHTANRPTSSTTELCVSRDSAWIRARDAWNGELFETERLSLATLGSLDLIPPLTRRLPAELKSEFYCAYLPELMSAYEAEQACDIVESRLADLDTENIQEKLLEALKLWWPPEQLQSLQDMRERIKHSEQDLEQWPRQIELRKERLCIEVLGIRNGDIVTGQQHGKTVSVQAERQDFYVYEDKVLFVIHGTLIKKDGLPGKRKETIYVTAPI